MLAAAWLSLVGCHAPSAVADTVRLDAGTSSGDAAPASLVESYPSQALGAPAMSEDDCRKAEAQSKNDDDQTQMGMNEVAWGNAGVAECEMRRAYVTLTRALARNANAVAKLESAQRYWIGFEAAGDGERFPHKDDPDSYYGSVFPMCLGFEHAYRRTDRSKTLAGATSCHETESDRGPAGEAARIADAALNDAYRKVRAKYASDPAFLTAFTRAEQAWLSLRDAQVALAGAISGAPGGDCATRELERVTKARTEQLRLWLAPYEEGNVCAGSYLPPRP